MTKKIVGSAIAILALLPVAAFANVQQTFLSVNGQPSDTFPAGDSYDGVLTFNSNGNSTVQSIRVEIPNSGFAGECIDVTPNQDASGTHTTSFTGNTTGATEGTWDVRITRFGKLNTQTGANNNCDTTIGQNSVQLFQDQLTLTAPQSGGSNANSTGGGSSGSNSSGSTAGGSTSASSTNAQIEALKVQIAALVAQLSGLTTVVAGMAPDAICSQAPSDTASLQNFLVGQNLMTAAEVATGPSIYGPKTTRAHSAFKSMHKCR